ncbi:hypothetical protein P7K49_023408 [Saguinus oedipus]|uniref:IF rod domain-containing protein n=1 Tax=Saguinus oedipus TaxID=9490 RepID=A0ABQ9UNW0_SAGOE|nr:hypothetical protein P7K49_023408 [Saguinus oedipus]
MQNRALEAELAALRQHHAEPSPIGELFQRELRDLRAQLEEAKSARAQALLERDGLADEVQRPWARCEEESRGREGAERALKAQQRDVDGATLACLDLEKKVESLLDELAFVAELLATLLASSQAAAEVNVALAKPELSSALREIRAQYESLAAKNLQSAEEWCKSKFANLKEQAVRSTEAIRASREEIHDIFVAQSFTCAKADAGFVLCPAVTSARVEELPHLSSMSPLRALVMEWRQDGVIEVTQDCSSR